jgi:hypothetical protein
MLSKEPDTSVGSTIATFFADLAFLVLICFILFTSYKTLYAVEIFAGFMGLACLIQIGTGWHLLQNEEST